MQSIIRQKIDLIAECIFAEVQKVEEKSFGLYGGEFGQLLFLFYYSKYSQTPSHDLLTEQYAERLLEQFAEKERIHTFSSGLAGIWNNLQKKKEFTPFPQDLPEYCICLNFYVRMI